MNETLGALGKPAHEKGAQTGDDTIRRTQIGRYPQLMFDEDRLGNDGTEASWLC